MHGATLAAAAALGLAEHLAHHGFHGDALGDVVSRGTVGGGHPVVLAQVIQHAHRAGLLAGALVNGAGHDSLQEQVVNALLVFADPVHHFVHAQGLFRRQKLTHI